MTTPKQLIAYWRDSLADAELAALELVEGNHVQVTPAALEQGQLDAQTTAALFAQSKQSAPRGDATTTIPVVVVPIVASSQSGRRGRPQRLCPLLIPAALDSHGRLQAQVGSQKPWIPRVLLEPTSSDLVLGSVDALDDFYLHNLRVFSAEEAAENWPETYALAWQMLRHVTDQQGQLRVEEAGYRISAKAAVVSTENLWGMSGNILRVYDHLLSRNEMPPCLANYLAQEPPPPGPPLTPTDWSTPAGQHFGSFNNQFPLSPTQRQAIHHFFSLEKHSILAVSGPPGTGKTTLLHSIIASLWVKAALNQERPPVIVATSTNNQAVTNVIDSLAGAGRGSRWLPVPSFGLYLVNTSDKQAKAEKRGILTANKYGDGFPARSETAAFVRQATAQYLAACAEFFGHETKSLDEAVKSLHQRMNDLAGAMVSGIEVAFQLHAYTRQMSAITRKHGTIAQYETELQQLLTRSQQALEKWQAIRKAWLHHQQNEPTSYSVLGIVASVWRKQRAGYELFLSEQMPGAVIDPDPAKITKMIGRKIQTAKAAVAEATRLLQEAQQFQLQLNATQAKWQQWCRRFHVALNWQALYQLEDETGTANAGSLLNWLDMNLRYELFILATHYWEGRWLQEIVEDQMTSPDFKEARNRPTQEKKWQRYAMLTPCFVTTMHTGPSFFDYYDHENKPLLDYIDLLVIDEAGQVTPEVSGAMLALARQALVVGDVKQIEPVWSILPQVDLGNLRRHKLAQTDADFAGLQAWGITASSGSVMQMAQHVSSFQIPAGNGIAYDRGMFLAEHRRCVPEIISYCNTVAYQGRLRPMRTALTDYPWPHLGYVHVKGQAALDHGSRKNEREAQTMVAWIADNQEAFTEHYGRTLDEIVGIITPFAAQKRVLLSALRQRRLELSKVGTVHALQGGERPIILFSPVYTTQDSTTRYFFDRGPNMLNVAVSRAQDSFVVFGDMDIFNSELNTPSGILARHLFARAENEMVGVPVPGRERVAEEAVHHIRTLDKHVRTLSRAFERAQKKLAIVSPFLRWRAVADDEICAQVQAAVNRGVSVDIYVDKEFNENLTLPAAEKAAAALRESGAQVHICHNIHSKVVCIDDEVFIEGSFNWLSAERSITNYARYETSIIYTGPMAATFIQETLADIQQRIDHDTDHVQRT